MHPVNYLFEDINRNYWGIHFAGYERTPRLRAEPAFRLRGRLFSKKRRQG